MSKYTEAFTANANKKVLVSNESGTTKMSAFSLYVEKKLSQLDKHDRRIAEKWISDILFEIEMSANMSAEKELNHQQQNPCIGFNFGIPKQGHQGSYNIQGHSYIDMLSK